MPTFRPRALADVLLQAPVALCAGALILAPAPAMAGTSAAVSREVAAQLAAAMDRPTIKPGPSIAPPPPLPSRASKKVDDRFNLFGTGLFSALVGLLFAGQVDFGGSGTPTVSRGAA